MFENMSDKEFMLKVDRGIKGELDKKIEVGSQVITVGLHDLLSAREKSSVGVVTQMIDDCLNHKIMTVMLFDESDDTYKLSNGYWYVSEFLELV